MSGKPVFLGQADNGVGIFFDVENGFWEGNIAVTNLKDGASLGEPLIVPQEYFYSLFGEKAKSLFRSVCVWRSLQLRIEREEEEIAATAPAEKCCRVDERIIFRFTAGPTLALRVDKNVEEAVKTILKLELEEHRSESQRTIETAAYIQAQRDGNPMGLSLL